MAVPTGPTPLDSTPPGGAPHPLTGQEEARAVEKEKPKARNEDTGLEGVAARTPMEHVAPKPEPHLASVRVAGRESLQGCGWSASGVLSHTLLAPTAQAHMYGASDAAQPREWRQCRGRGGRRKEGVSARFHRPCQSRKHLLHEQCDSVSVQYAGAPGLLPW